MFKFQLLENVKNRIKIVSGRLLLWKLFVPYAIPRELYRIYQQ